MSVGRALLSRGSLGGGLVTHAGAPETKPTTGREGSASPGAAAEPGGSRLRRALIAAATGADPRLTAVAVTSMIGLGLGLRLMDFGRPFYGFHMWNEVYYATIARNLDHFGFLELYNYDWEGGAELSQRHGPSPFVPWLVYLSTRLFGGSEAAARLPMLILGMLSLVAICLIARELYDAGIALLTAFFAAIMPGVVFLSRQVALDSPMVAFGLTAIWTLLRARRGARGRGALIAASSACLGITVFIKYTGVLFVPLLAWIWWTMIRQGRPARGWRAWLAPAAYFAVAALPALAWMVRGLLASSPANGTPGSLTQYLLRLNEWRPRFWLRALYSTWVRTGQQVGQLPWYLLVVAAVVSATPRRAWAFARQNAEVLLLIVPWLVPMIYPVSWYSNDAYTYPALYGVAILLALATRRVARVALERLEPSSGRAFACATLLAALVLGANLSDYKQYFGSWYKDKDFSSNWALQLPSNLVSQFDPFAPARIVRTVNTDDEPVLADTPATLYYAKKEDWKGKATWYWWMLPGELDELLEAIGSLEFTYVVFTYQPPALVVTALGRAGYEAIGPGVWQRPAGRAPSGASN